MSYNSWKLMDKIDVVVKPKSRYTYTGYIVEHGDKRALEAAKDWAREREWDNEKREYKNTIEGVVHTFDNKGFTARIVDSAGGSSQGGRLSFWACEVEKDGVKFTVGVNDEILAGLIKSSDISNGEVKQKVMFARKQGQPGLIHEGMKMYKDAVADMEHKASFSKASKTTKWEIGGVYQTLTQTDVCLGEVWDTMENYEETYTATGYWGGTRTRTSLRKTDTPKKVKVWFYLYNNDAPTSLTELLKERLERNYNYFGTGKPPARKKTAQLEVTDEDLKLIDRVLAQHEEYGSYGEPKVKGRYVRELK